MYYLSRNLVANPTPDQTRWLAHALRLPYARQAWVISHLLYPCVFVALRLSHAAGPITSMMIAILALTACVTSLAPLLYRALCSHAAKQLRASITDDEKALTRRHGRAAPAFLLACLGLCCVIAGYNLLSLSILTLKSGHPLETIFPQWAYVAIRLIIGGWVALMVGERWLLRSLKA